MKTSCPASRALSSLVLFWGVAAALPLSAQVSNSYNVPPPPGYPAPGAPAKHPSTRSTRQSAAAIQAPVTHPRYPSTYPPPAGYTYPPPPGYGIAPKTTTSKTASKPAAHGKSSAKTTSAKKTTAGPPPPPKVYGPTGDLTSQVSKIRDNDKVQNLRIGELERDVSSIKRSGKGSARYDGGTDLAAHTTYIARPGDTLWRIASTHRVSVGEIQQLNRMTEEEVHVGQALLIPSPHRLDSTTTQVSYTPATPSGGAASSGPVTVVSSAVYYTVKKGDSLKAIALKHKMTTASLASANKLKDANKIIVGQRLKIPGRTTTVTVESKAGAPRSESSDTIPLPGYGVPSTPPPPATGLAPAPAPPMPAAPAAPKGPDLSDSHRGILAYRVDRSDTIEGIAAQFTTTPDQIREMNRLTPGSALKAGDEIMVPAMGAVSLKKLSGMKSVSSRDAHHENSSLISPGKIEYFKDSRVKAWVIQTLSPPSFPVKKSSLSLVAFSLLLSPCMALGQSYMQNDRWLNAPQLLQNGQFSAQQAAYQEGFSDGKNDHKAGNSPHTGRHPTTHPGFETAYAQGYTDGYNSMNGRAGGGPGFQGGGRAGENAAAYQEGFNDGRRDHKAGNSPHSGRHPTTHPAFAAEYRRGYMDGYNSMNGGGGRRGGEGVAAYQEGFNDGKGDRRVGNSPHVGRHPTTHPGFEADYQRGYKDGYQTGGR